MAPVSPRLVMEWQTRREARTIVHDLLYSDDQVVTLRPPKPRRGTLKYFFATPSEAAACHAMHTDPAVLTLTAGIGDTEQVLSYVVAEGDLTVTLDPETALATVVEVPYRETAHPTPLPESWIEERRNLLPRPILSDVWDPAYWGVGAGVTVAGAAGGVRVTATSAIASWSSLLRTTYTGAAIVPVLPGDIRVGRVRVTNLGAATPPMSAAIQWYSGTGAALSDLYGPSVSLGAGESADLLVAAVAPANAARATFCLRCTAGFPAGTDLFVHDEPLLEVAPAAAFSGDTPPAEGRRRSRWLGARNRSESVLERLEAHA
ncbi:MAG: hypothetical protein ACK5O2_00845 [Microthrixaceae bacterium]